MASISKLRTTRAYENFDAQAALQLVQAFHRHLEPGGLLELLHAQFAALINTTGLRYQHGDITFSYGDKRAHTTTYNLTYREKELGELILYFAQPASDTNLTTAEDLIAIAISALNNAVAYHHAVAASVFPAPLAQPHETLDLAATERARHADRTDAPASFERHDALVLVALDNYQKINQRDGAAWAQTLVHSMLAQISQGLREADGVYQIEDDLIAVLLPKTPLAAAEQVAKKIRVLVASLHLTQSHPSFGTRGADASQDSESGGLSEQIDTAATTAERRVAANVYSQLTACMGVAGTRNAQTAEEVLVDARSALKAARQKGRNSIELFAH